MKMTALLATLALVVPAWAGCRGGGERAGHDGGHGGHGGHGSPATRSADPAPAGGGATAGVTPYPLDTCLVSGEKLGAMGDPYVFTHEGREIKLCCEGCLRDFQADPAAYLAKLR